MSDMPCSLQGESTDIEEVVRRVDQTDRRVAQPGEVFHAVHRRTEVRRLSHRQQHHLRQARQGWQQWVETREDMNTLATKRGEEVDGREGGREGGRRFREPHLDWRKKATTGEIHQPKDIRGKFLMVTHLVEAVKHPGGRLVHARDDDHAGLRG